LAPAVTLSLPCEVVALGYAIDMAGRYRLGRLIINQMLGRGCKRGPVHTPGDPPGGSRSKLSPAIGPPPLIFSPDGQGLAQYTPPCVDLSPPQYARIDLIPPGRFIAAGPPTVQVAGPVTAQSPRSVSGGAASPATRGSVGPGVMA